VRRLPIRWGLAARIAGGLAALAWGIGAVAVAVGPGRSTTYAGRSELTATLALAAGLALVLSGALMSLDRRLRPIGSLALIAAVVWFAPLWVGWGSGPTAVRSLGRVGEGLLLPIVVHMVLAQPDGRVRGSPARAVTACAYAGACLASLGGALFNNPFHDPDCWANCTDHDNAFLLHSAPRLAHSVSTTNRWFTLAITIAVAVLSARRLLAAPPPARRRLLPVDLPALLFAGAVAVRAAVPTNAIDEPSQRSVVLLTVTAGAVTLVAAGLGWNALRPTVTRRRVTGIVSSLGQAPAPGFLEGALARAVGEPGLRLAYWLPESRTYVDANGRPVAEPSASPGHEITMLVRGPQRVAVVSHAAGLSNLDGAFGPAVRLALDNERLQAQALAHMEELRSSRARIVKVGDAERRRLERDLHDGAQQRLLAASYEMQLARSAARDDGDEAAGRALTSVLDRTQTVLEELRGVAHGIFPAVLTEAGLAAALASLGDTALVRLEIEDVADIRYPPSTETTAYFVVAEAVEDAAARGADALGVKAVRIAEHLVIEVHDDGSARVSDPVRAADRVGALGGSIEFGPTTLRAELPCA
jgi:signal transduction histidine kinase